jgi:hypothetical protein
MKLKQNHETGLRPIGRKSGKTSKLWQFKPKSCVKETQNYNPSFAFLCAVVPCHTHNREHARKPSLPSATGPKQQFSEKINAQVQ